MKIVSIFQLLFYTLFVAVNSLKWRCCPNFSFSLTTVHFCHCCFELYSMLWWQKLQQMKMLPLPQCTFFLHWTDSNEKCVQISAPLNHSALLLVAASDHYEWKLASQLEHLVEKNTLYLQIIASALGPFKWKLCPIFSFSHHSALLLVAAPDHYKWKLAS